VLIEEDEGGQITSLHSAITTSLLILTPRSSHIFDLYAHPVWLPARLRAKVRRDRHAEGLEGESDEWARKIMLKRGWVERCLERGMFLVRDPIE
jgi:hypothetical protein